MTVKWWLLTLLSTLLLLTGCGPSNKHKLGMFHGKVIDFDTGRPIEGAVAHVTYKVNTSWMGSGVSHEMAVRETLTNAQGEYLIPEEIATIETPFKVDFKGWLQIYKPGYGYKNLSCPEEEKEKVRWLKEPTCIEVEGKYLIWELEKLTTKEERRNNRPSLAHDVPIEQQILLMQAINEKRHDLGYDLFDLPEGYAPMLNPPPPPPSPVKINEVEQSKIKCTPREVALKGIGKSTKPGSSLQMSRGYSPLCDENE